MPRMSHNGAHLRRVHAAVREAEATGVPVAEIQGRMEADHAARLARSLEISSEIEPERARTLDRVLGGDSRSAAGSSRRDFLRRGTGAGVALGAAAVVGAWPSAGRAQAATGPRIAVVGAGFAGLTAAYKIYKAKGWSPQVFEASTRLGGRVMTRRGCAGGQYLEAGGGGINTRDTNLQNLAGELGLTPLIDTFLNYPGSNVAYSFGGVNYAWSDIETGVTAIEDYAWNIWNQIKYVPTYTRNNSVSRTWDNRSVVDLINATAYPVTTAEGSYVANWFSAEYGGRASDASALHYVMESGGAYRGSGWDERYCIPGGNDILATTLASALPAGSITYDRQLAAVVKNADGTYTLTFRSAGGPTHTVVTDRVVLAIPPTMLRGVDLSHAGISSVHTTEIQKHNLGTGAKLNFQFSGMPWDDAGYDGEVNSDTSVQMAWSSQFQATDPAILIMLGNRQGDYDATTPAHGVAPAAIVSRTLADLDKWSPDSSALVIPGQTYLDFWPNDPFVKGTWSYYGLGGFTTYGGVEGKREGNIHFAGEHTAPFVEHSTMCGAVSSGMRVATEVTSY